MDSAKSFIVFFTCIYFWIWTSCNFRRFYIIWS